MPATKKLKSDNSSPAADMSQQQAQAIAEACEILACQGDPEKTTRMARKKAKTEYLSSMHLIRAIDHQLRLFGSGLVDYRRMPQYCRVLKSDELRYMAQVPAGDGCGLQQRLVVKNLSTGQKRFETPEVPHGGAPVLVAPR